MIIRFIKYCWTTPCQASWKWWTSCITNILIVTVIIIVFCLLVTLACKSLFRCTGQIGDTIGGITAPIIGLISIWLLYITFREQRQFNEKQLEFNKEQVYFNEWQSLNNILARIEKNLEIEIKFDIYKNGGEPNHLATKSIRITDIRSLLTRFTTYVPKLNPDEGYKLYTILKNCYCDIILLIHLTPKSPVYENIMNESIKAIIEIIIPIYKAISKERIQFIPTIHNIDPDGDLKKLASLFKKDQALYNNLPPEYLPEQAKQ